MKVLTSSYYHEFACLGGSCPVTCCFGWGIPLDREACDVYARTKGLWGMRLRMRVTGSKLKAFRLSMGKCPFHNGRRLCSIQLSLGVDHMPRVCREYPRQLMNLGPFGIRLLDTGCPEAARLLLHAEKPFALIPEEEGDFPECHVTNEDKGFPEALAAALRALLDMLEEEEKTPAGLNRFAELLYAFAGEAHASSVGGGGLPDPRRIDPVRSLPLFPFSIMLYNAMLSTPLFEERLSLLSPALYRPLRYYYRLFDRQTEIEGQKRLAEMAEKYFAEAPERMEKYLRLTGHFLMLDWFDLVEDYSFHSHLLQAVIHANLILLLDLLILEKEGELSEERQTAVLAAYTRRAHHNEDVAKALYRCLMDRYG